MKVSDILAEKGGDAICAKAADALEEVAALLASRRIGAVVVTDDRGRIAGILSERDIVRAIAQDGAAALTRPAGDYMTREVRTCVPDSTVDDVMREMTTGRFRHLPAIGADGAIVGMVSIGDVVKRVIDETVQEAENLRAYIAAV